MGEGEGEWRMRHLRLLDRCPVLSSVHYGAHVSCTVLEDMWYYTMRDLSLQM